QRCLDRGEFADTRLLLDALDEIFQGLVLETQDLRRIEASLIQVDLLRHENRFDDARRHIERAEIAARDLDAPVLLARVLRLYSGSGRSMGELDAAVAHLAEAAAVADGAGDRAVLALTKRDFGLANMLRGELAVARAAFTEARHLFDTLDDSTGVGTCLHGL